MSEFIRLYPSGGMGWQKLKCRLLQMIGEPSKGLQVHCVDYQIHGLCSQILITYRLANTCDK